MKYNIGMSKMTQEEMLFCMRFVELINAEYPPQPNQTEEELIEHTLKVCKILEAKGILSMQYEKHTGEMTFTVLNPEYFKVSVH